MPKEATQAPEERFSRILSLSRSLYGSRLGGDADDLAVDVWMRVEQYLLDGNRIPAFQRFCARALRNAYLARLRSLSREVLQADHGSEARIASRSSDPQVIAWWKELKSTVDAAVGTLPVGDARRATERLRNDGARPSAWSNADDQAWSRARRRLRKHKGLRLAWQHGW